MISLFVIYFFRCVLFVKVRIEFFSHEEKFVMLDLLKGIISLPIWAWVTIALIIGIVLVIVIKSDVVEIASKMFEKLFGPSFHVIGRRFGAFWRTKTGKTILPMIGLALLGLPLWFLLASPAIDSMASAVNQREINIASANAYNKVPTERHCIVMGNPFVNGKKDHEIEAWRADGGNQLCFQVHVTDPQKNLRAKVGIRTMEFSVCKNTEGSWAFERTARFLGNFEDDADYMTSMKKVAGILKNKCTPQGQVVAEQGGQPKPLAQVQVQGTKVPHDESQKPGAVSKWLSSAIDKVSFWK